MHPFRGPKNLNWQSCNSSCVLIFKCTCLQISTFGCYFRSTCAKTRFVNSFFWWLSARIKNICFDQQKHLVDKQVSENRVHLIPKLGFEQNLRFGQQVLEILFKLQRGWVFKKVCLWERCGSLQSTVEDFLWWAKLYCFKVKTLLWWIGNLIPIIRMFEPYNWRGLKRL